MDGNKEKAIERKNKQTRFTQGLNFQLAYFLDFLNFFFKFEEDGEGDLGAGGNGKAASSSSNL